jgi:hypothetical protein
MASDINEFANELLLDFMDLAHDFLKNRLQHKFGTSWFEDGVAKHIGPKVIDRTKEMLTSPMRVVEMGKTTEDLYGIEHLDNVIQGNWDLFKDAFKERERTRVALSEITEVRHNVAHRRNRHYLRRSELVRLAQNCASLLTAFGNPKSQDYSHIAESISSGGVPWGFPLTGWIPPEDEILFNFIEREEVSRPISHWFMSDSRQLVVWGDGGTGKSSLAYNFVREVRSGGAGSLLAVAWVSAKQLEYREGNISPATLFRGAVLAAEGLESMQDIQRLLQEWQVADPGDGDLRTERDRLKRRFPAL